MTVLELIGVAIGSAAAIIAAIAKLIEVRKVKKEKKEVEKTIQEEELKKNKSIEGLRRRGEIRRQLRKLIEEYSFLSTDVLRFHNSGYAMAPVNSKLKVTIEYEQLMTDKNEDVIPGLKHKKDLWQAREIDEQMESFIEDMLIDKIHHLKDIEFKPENKGIRKIYNGVLGNELLFIEIGFVGYDYLVLAIQRERKGSTLSEKNKNIIEYYVKAQAENILNMIKSTRY